jgi:YHS domain-containing protein
MPPILPIRSSISCLNLLYHLTRWSEFEADRDEARRLITEIEKLKKSNESEVDCYQCQEKKAIRGTYFPFCSPECKKQWANIHFKDKRIGPKYTTIEACQHRCKELAAQSKNSNIEKIAQEIFGSNR